MSEEIELPDLNNSIEIEMEEEKALTIPQLISLLKPSFEKSDFQKMESILARREAALTEALILKEAERIELKSRCESLLKRCSQLEEQLELKQQDVGRCKIALENVEQKVNDLYVELLAEKMEARELRSRVSVLEKGRGVIEISDSEGNNDKDGILEKDEVLVEEEGFLLIPTPKRKRASRIVTSDSEDDGDDVPIAKLRKEKSHSPHCNDQMKEDVVCVEDDEDEDDDDNIPIGKLRERRLGDKNGNGEDMAHHSRRRLFKLGERSTMKDDEERGASSRDSISEEPLPMRTQHRSAAQQRLVFSAIEDAKEKKVDDVDSESGGESIAGFIVDGSESDGGSESTSGGPSEEDKDEGCSNDFSREDSPCDVDLNDVLSAFRRKKDAKKWEYEADMLASFAENPKLCMKAVCVLYRQQTQEERSIKGTIVVNNRGFNHVDAFRASMIAEFLLDGNQYGPPKKSVEEFVKRYPNGLEYCRRIAERYSKQLFTIYQQGEDPFFAPS